MKWKNLESPYAGYEISDAGFIRRTSYGSASAPKGFYLKPSSPTRGGLARYGLRLINGKQATPTVAALMKSYFGLVLEVDPELLRAMQEFVSASNEALLFGKCAPPAWTGPVAIPLSQDPWDPDPLWDGIRGVDPGVYANSVTFNPMG